MQKTIAVLLLFAISLISLQAQDSTTILANKTINTQSLLLVKTAKPQSDSIKYTTPKHKQGFFCNFEDQLNRKKVPIDFSLGNSKY